METKVDTIIQIGILSYATNALENLRSSWKVMGMAKLPNYYNVNIDGLNVKLEPIYEELVEVVRCKDCKWYAPNNEGSWIGCAFDTRHPDDVPKVDDFCSYGERKDNDP